MVKVSAVSGVRSINSTYAAFGCPVRGEFTTGLVEFMLKLILRKLIMVGKRLRDNDGIECQR